VVVALTVLVAGGGGAVCQDGARVRPLATGGEVCTPWWLAANLRFCQHRWASIGIDMADM
jgi:hypothetical protein